MSSEKSHFLHQFFIDNTQRIYIINCNFLFILLQGVPMRFGFHISIAGGFSRVVERAHVRGCETIQFFYRNPRGWKYSPLNKKEVKAFRSSIQSSTLSPVFLHMPYLLNIASLKSKFYRRSIHSIATDLKRAEQLGAQYLIVHIKLGTPPYF